MAKKMTIDERIDNAWRNNVTTPHGATDFHCYSDGFKAGWRARGRANAATKADAFKAALLREFQSKPSRVLLTRTQILDTITRVYLLNAGKARSAK